MMANEKITPEPTPDEIYEPLPPDASDPEPPPPLGQIVKAVDMGHGVIELTVIYTGTTSEDLFYASENDPYGDGPRWWAELQRALAAGEITVEPEPPPPEPEPH